MRGILVSALFAALAASASQLGPAGTPQQPPQAEVKPEDRCTVEGTVVDAKTLEPIKRASVSLYRSDPGAEGASYGAITDAAGRFKITDIDPGRYSINAFKTGFSRQSPMDRRPGQRPSMLALGPKQVIRDLDFKLAPGAVVTGRVVDEGGEPMAYVSVRLLRQTYLRGRRQLMTSNGGTTDDRGEYRMHSLPAGRYFVSATYVDQRMNLSVPSAGQGSGQDEGYAPLYYPGVTDASQAVPIQLQEGDERNGIDFRLSPVRTVRIGGRVLNGSTGQPLKNGAISLMQRGSSFGMAGSFGRVRNGVFELRGVTPGAYYLEAFNDSGGERSAVRRALDVGTSNIEGVELVLRPGLELSGSVQPESPDPKLSLGDLRVFLAPTESTPVFQMGPTTLTADGSFKLRGLMPGDFRVTINSMPPGYYVKSVRLGDTESSNGNLTLTEGTAGELKIVISANAGAVDGAASDDKGKPAPGATVVLVPEGEKRSQFDLYKASPTDQYGRYSIKTVPPGDYKLFAWDSVEPGAYSDPAFLDPFEDKGRKITVGDKSQQSVDLTVLQAADKK
jgi:protocatechuate 3,4-dioxygenase beta subunit